MTTVIDSDSILYEATALDDTDSTHTTAGAEFYTVDTTNGTLTVELSTSDTQAGFHKRFVDVGGNIETNAVTFTTEGSENVDGGASVTWDHNNGSYVDFWSDGTDWFTSLQAAADNLGDTVADAFTTNTSFTDASSNTIADFAGQGLEVASNAVRILTSIWDGTDLVADVNNTNTTTTNLDVAGNGAVSGLLSQAVEHGRVLADDGATYSTIQAAENAATDWIFIGPGTFSENVTVDTAGLTVIGSGRGTLIDGDTGDALKLQGGGNTIENLAVKTTAGGGNTARGIVINTNNDNILDRIWVEESDDAGIRIVRNTNIVTSVWCDSANIDGNDIEVAGNNNVVDDIIGTVTDSGTGNAVGETA